LATAGRARQYNRGAMIEIVPYADAKGAFVERILTFAPAASSL
jgi:hypothetical protein